MLESKLYNMHTIQFCYCTTLTQTLLLINREGLSVTNLSSEKKTSTHFCLLENCSLSSS